MIDPLPSLQSLRALESAARHESYSLAAKELELTYGAVSHHIKALEQRLGVPLFQKRGRGVVLTNDGQRVVHRIRQGLMSLEAIFAEQQASDNLEKKGPHRLVVNMLPSFAVCWMAPRASDFSALYPDIKLEIVTSWGFADFKSGGIDIALRYGTGHWSNVEAVHLFQDYLFPVCAPEVVERYALTTPADYTRAPLFHIPWLAWSSWLRAVGLPPREPSDGMSCDDGAAILAMARKGQGLALSRLSLAHGDLKSGALVCPFNTAVVDPYGYYLVYPSGSPLAAPARQFSTWLMGEARAMEKEWRLSCNPVIASD